MIDAHHGWNASFKPQCLGFVVSIILTLATYLVVERHHLSDGTLTVAVFSFAIAQAILQLIFFLHLGLESKPHWNTITFIFTILVIIIVVGGSLWIMNNLDYNLMPMQEQMRDIQHQGISHE